MVYRPHPAFALAGNSNGAGDFFVEMALQSALNKLRNEASVKRVSNQMKVPKAATLALLCEAQLSV